MRDLRIILIFLIFILLVACTEGTANVNNKKDEQAQADKGRTDLNIGIEASPTTLIPNTDPNFVKDLHLKSIFEPLIGREPDGTMTPLLATEWESVDDYTWRFKLREDVTFHNGEPLTAEAVKFTIDYVMDEENMSGYTSHFAPVKEVHIIDDLNFEIITHEPTPALPIRLADNLLIMEPNYMKEVGNEGAAELPIGTGPFTFTEMKKDQYFIMEAYKDYWAGEVALEKVTYKVIPEFSARLSAFLAGEIDILNNLPVDSMNKIEESDHGKIESVSSARVIYYGLNAEEGSPFEDKRIRQAVNYAIDKEALLEHVLNGQGTLMTGPLSEVNEGYVPTEDYEYNPEKAQKLLEEAGYGQEELQLTLETTSDRYPMDVQVAQAVSTQLADVGFDVSVQVNEYSTHLTRTAEGDAKDIYLSSMGTQFDAVGSFKNLFLPGSTFLVHLAPEDIQEKILEAETIIDKEEQIELFTEIQNWAVEEAVMVPLWQQGDLYATHRDLEFYPRVDQRYILTDVKWKDR